MTRALERLARAALAEREARGLLRSRDARTIAGAPGARVVVRGRELKNFASNAYLGLGTHPEVIAACVREAAVSGASSTASRLISGNLEATAALERSIAALKGTEDALVFSSGYLANLGVCCALGAALDEKAIFLSDALNHASLIDGCRLSKAELEIYAHADAEDVARRLRAAAARGLRAVILTESRFSMDGDLAPLRALAELAEQFDATLVVDEAHSTGVDGDGRGLVHALGLDARVDVVIGTLGKALGAHGAFVAGTRTLCRWLENAARSFVFTTGLPGPIAAAARAAIDVLCRDRPDKALWSNVQVLRDALAPKQIAVHGPIVPVILGDPARTVAAAHQLERAGFLVGAVRPPTVPDGTSRLRITVRADHREEDLVALAEQL